MVNQAPKPISLLTGMASKPVKDIKPVAGFLYWLHGETHAFCSQEQSSCGGFYIWIMTRVHEAIKEYLTAINQLEKLGVVRTQGEIIGDYGEWLAAKKFKLNLAKSLVNKNYDATDSHGKTYQIKTRVVKSKNSATSFDFRNNLGEFDYLIVVLLGGETLEPFYITKIPRQFVKKHIYKNQDNYRFRLNKKIIKLLSG